MGKEYNEVEEYRDIAHNLKESWVNTTYKQFKRITIDRTFKETKTENIEILRSEKRKMLLVFPHVSYDDMVLPQYEIIEYNVKHKEEKDSLPATPSRLQSTYSKLLSKLPKPLSKLLSLRHSRKDEYSIDSPIKYPITFAGSNLYIHWYLKRAGCAKFRRNVLRNLKETKYATYLLGKEDRDVLIFPGFLEYEEGRTKSGRSWDGRIQKMSPIPVYAAKRCYEKYGKDIDFIIINITYEPLTPEEGAFQLLIENEFSKKWYNKFAKKIHFKQLVTLIDFLQFVRPYKKLNITAHTSFHGPYSFEQLNEDYSKCENPEQEICNFLEKEGRSKIKLTAHDVWAYSISIKAHDRKEVVSSATSLLGYVWKQIKNGIDLVEEDFDEKRYRNDEIMKNASEIIEKLDGKVDLSLVKEKDLLSEVKKSGVVFGVNETTTKVNDEFLYNYHRNRVAGLVEDLYEN